MGGQPSVADGATAPSNTAGGMSGTGTAGESGGAPSSQSGSSVGGAATGQSEGGTFAADSAGMERQRGKRRQYRRVERSLGRQRFGRSFFGCRPPKKTENAAFVRVALNKKLVQQNVTLNPAASFTEAGIPDVAGPQPIALQDHREPVDYRMSG